MDLESAKIWAAATLDSGSQFTFREQSNGMCSMIKVRRSDRSVIGEFYKNFGGSVSQMKSGSYEWILQGMVVTQFLKDILPYLRTKMPQALVLMEFNEYLLNRKESGQLRKRLELEDIKYRNGIIQKIKSLNKPDKAV